MKILVEFTFEYYRQIRFFAIYSWIWNNSVVTMALINIQQADNNVTYTIEGLSVEEVSTKVNEYFTQQNYKLEKGTKEDGVYGIGNDVLRLLLGAFVKRYKFSVNVTASGNQTLVTFAKAMSGVSGGAIGYAKLNKEYKKVIEDLKTILA